MLDRYIAIFVFYDIHLVFYCKYDICYICFICSTYLVFSQSYAFPWPPHMFQIPQGHVAMDALEILGPQNMELFAVHNATHIYIL